MSPEPEEGPDAAGFSQSGSCEESIREVARQLLGGADGPGPPCPGGSAFGFDGPDGGRAGNPARGPEGGKRELPPHFSWARWRAPNEPAALLPYPAFITGVPQWWQTVAFAGSTPPQRLQVVTSAPHFRSLSESRMKHPIPSHLRSLICTIAKFIILYAPWQHRHRTKGLSCSDFLTLLKTRCYHHRRKNSTEEYQ